MATMHELKIGDDALQKISDGQKGSEINSTTVHDLIANYMVNIG